jgi:hypothetical protein
MGQRGGWHPRVRAGSHGMGFWKFISNEWHRFSTHIKLILGDGSIISFWEEKWCGGSPLREVYPGLYSIASKKVASIVDNSDLVRGSSQWNVSFIRALNDWEVEELASLYSLLYSFNLVGGGDKIWRVPNRKRKV